MQAHARRMDGPVHMCEKGSSTFLRPIQCLGWQGHDKALLLCILVWGFHVHSLSTTVHTQRRTLQCLPTRTNLKAPSDASPSFSLPLPLPHREEEEKKKRREKEKRLVVEERETKPNPNRGRRRRRRNQTQPRRLRRRRRRRRGGSPSKAHRSSACGELF
ncbi:hypothetical protein DAI22_01g063208 [Oryza sativa Japonica Group]|nr:hypothetical protein DAI22_01g063208 [Oryza sativa Japonica Group]